MRKLILISAVSFGLASSASASTIGFSWSSTGAEETPSFSVDQDLLSTTLLGSTLSFVSFGGLDTYTYTLQNRNGSSEGGQFFKGTGPIFSISSHVLQTSVNMTFDTTGAITSYSFLADDDPCSTSGRTGGFFENFGQAEFCNLGSFSGGVWSIGGEFEPAAPIPLPASLPLLAAGIMGLGMWRRKQRRG